MKYQSVCSNFSRNFYCDMSFRRNKTRAPARLQDPGKFRKKLALIDLGHVLTVTKIT